MRETGNGVFLLAGWKKETIRPFHALSLIEGAFGNIHWERVATKVVIISVRHGAWCGMERQRLSAVLRADGPANNWNNFRALQEMIQAGLLEIPRRRGILAFLNCLEPQIVCPTKLFITRIAHSTQE